jgi:hypothetical protein
MLIAFVTAAVKIAQERQGQMPPDQKAVTPICVLDEIIIGRFKHDIAEGKTLVSSSEAGGSVAFSLAGEFTPADVIDLAVEAKMWIAQQENPDDPTCYRWPKRRTRLRATFTGHCEPSTFF